MFCANGGLSFSDIITTELTQFISYHVNSPLLSVHCTGGRTLTLMYLKLMQHDIHMCTIIFSLEVVEPLHMEMLWPIDLSKILGDSLQKPPLMEILTERPGRLEKTLQRISFPLRTFSLSGLSPMEMASDTPAESHNPLNIFTKKPMTLTEMPVSEHLL